MAITLIFHTWSSNTSNNSLPTSIIPTGLKPTPELLWNLTWSLSQVGAIDSPFSLPSPFSSSGLSDLPSPPQSGILKYPKVIISNHPSGMVLGTLRLSCSSKVAGRKVHFWLKETLLFLGVAFTLRAVAPLGGSGSLHHGRLPHPWFGAFHYYPLDTSFFAHEYTLGSVCYLFLSTKTMDN